MARKTTIPESELHSDGPKRTHVIKLRLDGDELKGLRVAAAMQGERPSDWIRQVVLAEIQRVIDVEVPKLRSSKKK